MSPDPLDDSQLCNSCSADSYKILVTGSLIINKKQDACTGVHSACRREKNGHNLDIWELRLRQGQMQIFLCLKVGKGLDFQKWDLNRAHETERNVFPIPQVFGMCRRRL